MRILHVIEATATGTLSMASLLANSQLAEGHEVFLAYSNREETPKNLGEIFSKGTRFSRFDMSGIKGKATAIWKLADYIEKIKPEKIFLHSSFAGFIGRMSCLKAKYKGDVYYLPHCISFMRQDVGSIKRSVFVLLERVAALKKTTYVACSVSEKEAIQRELAGQEVVVIENAVENKLFKGGRPAGSEKNSKIITVGQIRSQKNPASFAKIAMKLKEMGLDIEFIWVGDGDFNDREMLVEAGVNVTGWLSRDQVIEKLYESDIYLSTARWEGMPVSIIEAAYAGLPIVASRCAGNLDVVEHEHSGYLFDNEEEAAKWVELLYHSEELRKKISRKAREIALGRFSVSRYQQQMSELINKGRLSSNRIELMTERVE